MLASSIPNESIHCNTQAINDYQERTLQASKEIADSYLESQKEIVNAFQSIFAPYIENGYKKYWTSPATISEIYTKTILQITQ